MPIKPGDRVALVYPNNDPISFICGFYGCLMASVVPVPVEVPTSKRVGYRLPVKDWFVDFTFACIDLFQFCVWANLVKG